MKLVGVSKIIILLFLYLEEVVFSEPVLLTTSVAIPAMLTLGFLLKDTIICSFSECCTQPWVEFNQTAFNASLRKRVYGQPLLYKLTEAINEHLNNRKPAKALALALHGPTGTGKNYAVSILAEHLFKLKSRSRFYHFFSATVHFPHKAKFDIYADQIHEWIRGNVSQCSRSVFVFDEIDKMSHSLLDRLKPFLDYHDNINGIDYRRAIFIFLSNSGSKLIMNRMMQAKRNGQNRNEVANSANFDHSLSVNVFSSNDSALSNSALLKHHLISRFIPFLPLERDHVIGCIKDYLKSHHTHLDRDETLEISEKVTMQLEFVPSKERFFSSVGCKRIVDKVLMVLEQI